MAIVVMGCLDMRWGVVVGVVVREDVVAVMVVVVALNRLLL
jgi:hypothetical protein